MSNHFGVLVVYLVLLFDIKGTLGQIPCTGTSPDGSRYDLSELKKEGLITQPEGTYVYKVSVCENLVQCGKCSTPVGYCQDDPTKGYQWCIGSSSQGGFGALDDGKGVELLYLNGESGRQGKVIINCDPGGPRVSNKKAVSPKTVVGYEFHFSSSAACPIHEFEIEGLSPGSIFLILLLVLIILYLIVGILYNKIKNDKSGVELIPNSEFWISFPGLVKDGFHFVIEKARGFR